MAGRGKTPYNKPGFLSAPKPIKSDFKFQTYIPSRSVKDDDLIEYFSKLNEGNLNDIKNFLNLHSRIINSKDKHNENKSALHVIIENEILSNQPENKLKIVNYLIEMGANVNSFDSNNIRPIHIASMLKLTKIVNKLLQKGANPNIKSNEGLTALHYALIGNTIECDNGNANDENIKNFISECGIDSGHDHHMKLLQMYVDTHKNLSNKNGNILSVNLNYGFNLGGDKLEHRCLNYDRELVELLMNNNFNHASPFIRDFEDQTPIFYAIKYMNFDAISILIEKSSIYPSIRSNNIFGMSPYQYYVSNFLVHLNGNTDNSDYSNENIFKNFCSPHTENMINSIDKTGYYRISKQLESIINISFVMLVGELFTHETFKLIIPDNSCISLSSKKKKIDDKIKELNDLYNNQVINLEKNNYDDIITNINNLKKDADYCKYSVYEKIWKSVLDGNLGKYFFFSIMEKFVNNFLKDTDSLINKFNSFDEFKKKEFNIFRNFTNIRKNDKYENIMEIYKKIMGHVFKNLLCYDFLKAIAKELTFYLKDKLKNNDKNDMEIKKVIEYVSGILKLSVPLSEGITLLGGSITPFSKSNQIGGILNNIGYIIYSDEISKIIKSLNDDASNLFFKISDHTEKIKNKINFFKFGEHNNDGSNNWFGDKVEIIEEYLNENNNDEMINKNVKKTFIATENLRFIRLLSIILDNLHNKKYEPSKVIFSVKFNDDLNKYFKWICDDLINKIEFNLDDANNAIVIPLTFLDANKVHIDKKNKSYYCAFSNYVTYLSQILYSSSDGNKGFQENIENNDKRCKIQFKEINSLKKWELIDLSFNITLKYEGFNPNSVKDENGDIYEFQNSASNKIKIKIDPFYEGKNLENSTSGKIKDFDEAMNGEGQKYINFKKNIDKLENLLEIIEYCNGDPNAVIGNVVNDSDYVAEWTYGMHALNLAYFIFSENEKEYNFPKSSYDNEKYDGNEFGSGSLITLKDIFEDADFKSFEGKMKIGIFADVVKPNEKNVNLKTAHILTKFIKYVDNLLPVLTNVLVVIDNIIKMANDKKEGKRLFLNDQFKAFKKNSEDQDSHILSIMNNQNELKNGNDHKSFIYHLSEENNHIGSFMGRKSNDLKTFRKNIDNVNKVITNGRSNLKKVLDEIIRDIDKTNNIYSGELLEQRFNIVNNKIKKKINDYHELYYDGIVNRLNNNSSIFNVENNDDNIHEFLVNHEEIFLITNKERTSDFIYNYNNNTEEYMDTGKYLEFMPGLLKNEIYKTVIKKAPIDFYYDYMQPFTIKDADYYKNRDVSGKIYKSQYSNSSDYEFTFLSNQLIYLSNDEKCFSAGTQKKILYEDEDGKYNKMSKKLDYLLLNVDIIFYSFLGVNKYNVKFKMLNMKVISENFKDQTPIFEYLKNIHHVFRNYHEIKNFVVSDLKNSDEYYNIKYINSYLSIIDKILADDNVKKLNKFTNVNKFISRSAKYQGNVQRENIKVLMKRIENMIDMFYSYFKSLINNGTFIIKPKEEFESVLEKEDFTVETTKLEFIDDANLNKAKNEMKYYYFFYHHSGNYLYFLNLIYSICELDYVISTSIKGESNLKKSLDRFKYVAFVCSMLNEIIKFDEEKYDEINKNIKIDFKEINIIGKFKFDDGENANIFARIKKYLNNMSNYVEKMFMFKNILKYDKFEDINKNLDEFKEKISDEIIKKRYVYDKSANTFKERVDALIEINYLISEIKKIKKNHTFLFTYEESNYSSSVTQPAPDPPVNKGRSGELKNRLQIVIEFENKNFELKSKMAELLKDKTVEMFYNFTRASLKFHSKIKSKNDYILSDKDDDSDDLKLKTTLTSSDGDAAKVISFINDKITTSNPANMMTNSDSDQYIEIFEKNILNYLEIAVANMSNKQYKGKLESLILSVKLTIGKLEKIKGKLKSVDNYDGIKNNINGEVEKFNKSLDEFNKLYKKLENKDRSEVIQNSEELNNYFDIFMSNKEKLSDFDSRYFVKYLSGNHYIDGLDKLRALYRDTFIPKMNELNDAFDKLQSIIGDNNLRTISNLEYKIAITLQKYDNNEYVDYKNDLQMIVNNLKQIKKSVDTYNKDSELYLSDIVKKGFLNIYIRCIKSIVDNLKPPAALKSGVGLGKLLEDDKYKELIDKKEIDEIIASLDTFINKEQLRIVVEDSVNNLGNNFVNLYEDADVDMFEEIKEKYFEIKIYNDIANISTEVSKTIKDIFQQYNDKYEELKNKIDRKNDEPKTVEKELIMELLPSTLADKFFPKDENDKESIKLNEDKLNEIYDRISRNIENISAIDALPENLKNIIKETNYDDIIIGNPVTSKVIPYYKNLFENCGKNMINMFYNFGMFLDNNERYISIYSKMLEKLIQEHEELN